MSELPDYVARCGECDQYVCASSDRVPADQLARDLAEWNRWGLIIERLDFHAIDAARFGHKATCSKQPTGFVAMVSEAALNELIRVARWAHGFIIEAVLEGARVEGLDPNQHVTAAALRKAVEGVGFKTEEWLDPRRGTDEVFEYDDGGEWWAEVDEEFAEETKS